MDGMLVTLNLQGKRFKTTYDTVVKIPFFKDIIDDCGKPAGELFVNRSAHVFKHVLAYVVDDTYPFPHQYAQELNFYRIPFNKRCHQTGCYEPLVVMKGHLMKFCPNHLNYPDCGVFGCHYRKLTEQKLCLYHGYVGM